MITTILRTTAGKFYKATSLTLTNERLAIAYGLKYSRMDQVKFVKYRL